MLFNSIDFLLFFPCVIIGYYLLPSKVRYLWLLAASYFFYGNWNPTYIWLLFGCTIFTYFLGLLIENYRTKKPALTKGILGISIAAMLSVLAFYKYLDFGIGWINKILELIHISQIEWKPDILLPVGISFYTLQAMGYLIDVYRKEVEAETNFFRYALFIAFFPQLVAGPIERSKNLLRQLKKPTKFQYDNFRKGMLLIFWGLFCKMVIADRVAIIVNNVYTNTDYKGFYIVYATVLFAVQIYCDFYGYSTIARGTALTMGISLTDNFDAPYFSTSVKEFWRRWHISLSYWFRDYLYIPLGGNRKGNIRKQVNLLIVFAISGLWHGASLSFLLWGLLNGIYQVLGSGKYKLSKLLKKEQQPERLSCKILNRIVTFGLITFAWLFFRAGSISKSIGLIKGIFETCNWTIFVDGSLYQLGVSKEILLTTYVAILILAIVDWLKYKKIKVADMVMQQGWWFRAVCFIGLIIMTLLFGCYGVAYDTQQFIYFQF